MLEEWKDDRKINCLFDRQPTANAFRVDARIMMGCVLTAEEMEGSFENHGFKF